MELTPTLKAMISHRASSNELRDAAIADGMMTLRDSVRRLVLDGTTSLTEMQRIVIENLNETDEESFA